MMVLPKLLEAARNFTLRSRAQGVAFVTDRAAWANDFAATSLAKHLRERHGLRATPVLTARGLRGQIVHFIDRFAFLQPGTAHAIHESNRAFLTWFHHDSSGESDGLRAQLGSALRVIEAVVVPCETTRAAVLALGIPETKLVTIPLGVDLSLFRPPNDGERTAARRRLGLDATTVCIGSFQKDGVGWEEGAVPKRIKGPDVFLNVIERLRDRGLKLHVLLSGPARGFVKSGLEQLGVAYTHENAPDYRELAPLYHMLDLYLICSRCEGGPLAFMESWASGVPVVSTRMGMPADWIRHRTNGMLADSEDADGLAAACIELMTDTELRDRCRQQALDDVKELDWPELATRHYELYRPFLR